MDALNGLRMIKRTLSFSTPGTLRLHLRQLIWKGEDGREASIPIEDVGFILIESPLITVSVALLQTLVEHNVATVICDKAHLPSGYILPQTSHTLANRILKDQIALSDARARILWQHIITAKINNQASVLHTRSSEIAHHLKGLAQSVRRGDQGNAEAQAARAYFSYFADQLPGFHRERHGDMPNAALNYGYAILRAAVARALVMSGLNPALGIFHHNQYNHFALADDIIEPYRPFVDDLVLDNLSTFTELYAAGQLSPPSKRILLSIFTVDVKIGEMTRPLMNALSLTTASLAQFISGERKDLALPSFPSA